MQGKAKLTGAWISRREAVRGTDVVTGGGVDAAHAEEVVAGVGVSGCGLGEVPGHGPELLNGAGDTEVW